MTNNNKVMCPVCKNRVGTRAGRIAYHKWFIPHTGRRVPCGGVGRDVPSASNEADKLTLETVSSSK